MRFRTTMIKVMRFSSKSHKLTANQIARSTSDFRVNEECKCTSSGVSRICIFVSSYIYDLLI